MYLRVIHNLNASKLSGPVVRLHIYVCVRVYLNLIHVQQQLLALEMNSPVYGSPPSPGDYPTYETSKTLCPETLFIYKYHNNTHARVRRTTYRADDSSPRSTGTGGTIYYFSSPNRIKTRVYTYIYMLWRGIQILDAYRRLSFRFKYLDRVRFSR